MGETGCLNNKGEKPIRKVKYRPLSLTYESQVKERSRGMRKRTGCKAKVEGGPFRKGRDGRRKTKGVWNGCDSKYITYSYETMESKA